MPTRILHRTWCPTCQDWTLFAQSNTSLKYICRDCKCEETYAKFADIPEDKILEQRTRWQNSERQSAARLISRYAMHVGGLIGMDEECMVIESDAGQREIERRERQRRDEENYAIAQHLKRREEMIKTTGRNDMCPCGSGIKFKKCCLK